MSERLTASNHRQQRKLEMKETSRRVSMIMAIFGISAAVVLVGGITLGLLTLVKYYKEPEAVFEAVPKKQIKIPPKTPEHKMNVAKHEAAKPKPTFTRKLISTKPSKFALPDLPQVDLDQMLPLDPSELVSDQVSSLVGAAGMGSGLGSGLLGGGGTGTGMNFMGIQSTGSKILLIFDISLSVVNKVEDAGIPFSQIRDETIKLIEGLNPNMRFGIIQFSRAFRPYPKELVVGTTPNKENAVRWLEDNWISDGGLSRGLSGVITRNDDGVLEVLRHAFSMNPDVIFFISDASFQDNTNRTVPHDEIEKELEKLQKQAAVPGGVKFNFIGFGMRSDDNSSMKRIVRRNGGRLREMK